MRIPLSRPDIGEREVELVTRVLRSGQLSLGPVLAEFEEKFAQYVGTRFAIATNSGTSALHLCVRALGIGSGDEVLTTSFSFVASVNCLLYEQATPVFVDIDPVTLNIDPKKIRDVIARGYKWESAPWRLVNRRTGRILKALLPVHIFGLPCDMNELVAISREFSLPIIEDACEALGAEHNGQRVGTFGNASAFAFYPNKQITTAEGGMVVTNDPNVAKLCRSMRNQGRDEDSGWLRHERLGFNYRLSELHCALGIAQLERIDELLAARARVAEAYSCELATVEAIRLPGVPNQASRSWFVYVIRLQNHYAQSARDSLIGELRKRGIGCQAYFPAIHEQPYLQDATAESDSLLPHTIAASQRCIALPLFVSMTDVQVSEVCAAVREAVGEISANPDHFIHKEEINERARYHAGSVGAD